MINVIKTDIPGIVIIEPKIFGDSRGYFYESYSQRDFEENVAKVTFVQDNQSFSHYGVLRGLHFQNPPYTQSKLVRVIQGKVVDVAVDIRKGSPTYGKYVAVELTEENPRQFHRSRSTGTGGENCIDFEAKLKIRYYRLDMSTKAFRLVGETLPGGWTLTEKYTKGDGDTGGNFSDFDLTELRGTVGMEEFANAGYKKSRKLFNQSLVAPNDNSFAQAQLMMQNRHLELSFPNTPINQLYKESDVNHLEEVDICLVATQGLICFRTGNVEDGTKLYEQAIELSRPLQRKEYHYSAILNYCRELLRTGKDKDVKEKVQNLLGTVPDYPKGTSIQLLKDEVSNELNSSSTYKL